MKVVVGKIWDFVHFVGEVLGFEQIVAGEVWGSEQIVVGEVGKLGDFGPVVGGVVLG